MTTEQMIEEALKEFEREFIDKVQIGEDEYDVALKDKPQDMFDFLKKQLTTIATKSAEEEGKSWYFEGDELVITKGKWVIDRYQRNNHEN